MRCTAGRYAGNATWANSTINVWDAANRIVSDGLHLVQEATPSAGFDFSESVHFRYIMDNAVPAVLPTVNTVVAAQQAAVDDQVTLCVAMYTCLAVACLAAHRLLVAAPRFIRVQLGLMSVLVLTLLLLGLHVFRRALTRVLLIKRGVNEVAMALPADTLKELVDKATKAIEFVKAARKKVESSIHEQEEEDAANPATQGLPGKQAAPFLYVCPLRGSPPPPRALSTWHVAIHRQRPA